MGLSDLSCRFARYVCLLFASFITASPTLADDVQRAFIKSDVAAESDALFNGGESGDGHYAVWLYGLHGGCPNLRKLDPNPLVFALKAPGDQQDVSHLRYCFQILETKPTKISKCTGGSVAIRHADHSVSLAGRYSFVLANGEHREGTFRAAYCPPETSE